MPPLSKVQKEVSDKVAELLAQSTINDELKDFIIGKLDKIPEHLIFELLDALETEDEQLEKIAGDISTYVKNQEEGWTEVEDSQQNIADQYLEDMANKLDEEARIEELRESIS